MSKRKAVLGIDTSNYTTSVALMYTDGELIANIKKPLTVKAGNRGLRQSDAVFSHVKNLPDVMREAHKYLSDAELTAVGVSMRPRNVEGSYMPCFLSGVAVAESIASVCSVPLYRYSHQCGHIMAAVYSSQNCELLDGREFCAFHVSGGTTEMLKVRAAESGFQTELIGGTADVNAGQIIDRIGVLMGLPFPSGAYMERLALENRSPFSHKMSKAKDFKVNFSGLENMATEFYKKTENKSATAAFVFDYIGNTLCSLAEQYTETFGDMPFVFAGGVMCNSIIRTMLGKRFNASFAEAAMSSDNAVGIAALTARAING